MFKDSMNLNYILKHTVEHSGNIGQEVGRNGYEFKTTGLTGSYRTCMQWQVDEDYRVELSESEHYVLLNNKIEWFTQRKGEFFFKTYPSLSFKSEV